MRLVLRRRELFVLMGVLVLAPGVCSAAQSAAAAAFLPAANLSLYDVEKDQDIGLGGGHVITHHAFNADASTAYAIADFGPPEAPWEIVSLRRGTYFDRRLTENARNEFAAVPSPDETKLLVLAEVDGALALVVMDLRGNDLARVANGLDMARSQFAWSSDGAAVYYTAPEPGGTTMALHHATLDGKADQRLMRRIEQDEALPVDEFDACRKRDRVVALSGDELHVVDAGRITHTFKVEGPVEGLRVSPDGTKVAWGGRRIVIFSLETGKVEAATSPPEHEFAFDRMPEWSPDGTQLAFERATRFGSAEGPVMTAYFVRMKLDDGSERSAHAGGYAHRAITWLPTGKMIMRELVSIDAVSPYAYEIGPPPELARAPGGATWTRSNGPYGGWVSALKVAPSDGRIVCAITQGRLYTTDDAGEHWRVIGEGFDDVAVDPKDPRILYAASSGQLKRSTDGGSTWADYGPKDNECSIAHVAAHPTQPGVLYALKHSGGSVRIDGEQATELGGFEGDMYWPAFHVDRCNTNMLVVQDLSGPWHLSLDGGTTWHEATKPAEQEEIVFLAGSADDADLVLAMTYAGRVYYSSDGGENWELYADPSSLELWSEAIERKVSASFPLTLGRGKDEWLEDAGRSLVSWIAADRQNADRLYLPGGEAGIYRTDDRGKTWKPANTGFGVLRFDSIAPMAGGRGRLVGVSNDLFVYSTSDSGASWTSVGPIGHQYRAVLGAHPHVPGLVFMAQYGGGVYRSTDSGTTWEAVFDGNAQIGNTIGCRFQFDPDPLDHITLCAPSWVLESTDGGASWDVTAAFDAPDTGGLDYAEIVATPKAFSLTSHGSARIFQTRDGGATWRVLDGPYRTRPIASMIGRPGNDGALCVLGDRDRFGHPALLSLSKDAGTTWEARPLPEVRSTPQILARHPAELDTLAVAYDNGTVIVSRDEGRTWRDTGAGLPEGEAHEFAFGPDDNRLYIFLPSAGLFWIELPAN